jgi:hypothetical protein
MSDWTRTLATFAALSLWNATSTAGSIDFEDLPTTNDGLPTLADEYVHLGVNFVTTDDGATWSGMSHGDPGGWEVDGSAGPAFLGFDGTSYSFVAFFESPVAEVQLDVARAAGGTPFLYFDDFTLFGFRNGRFVEQQRAFFLAINEWQTVALKDEVDLIVGVGQGLRDFRFAVDNIRWLGEEEVVRAVDVDIRPGSDRNPINLRSRGVVPVILYGSDDVDVESIDPETTVFGPDGAPLAHREGPHFADHDADGHLDLMLHFLVSESGLLREHQQACVFGATFDGDLFEGCDVISPLPER